MKFSNEAKVGILVTAALAALLWGLNYLKGKDFFSSNRTYYAVYDDVGGLVKSNAVIMNGFRIGIVDKIEFKPDHSGKLIVKMLIDKKTFISNDAVAVIFSSDILGQKAMRIDLGMQKEPADDGDTLQSLLQTSLTERLGNQVGPLKDKTEALIVSIDTVVTMLHDLFDPKTKENLRGAIANLNHSLTSLDNSISNDKGKLNIMLSNLESITTNIKNNNKQINTILNNLSQVSDSLARANFTSAINNADRVLAQAADVFTKINKGEGSLGQMVNDRKLYDNLDSTAKNLDELIKDLKANPKRYLHFSVFGKNAK